MFRLLRSSAFRLTLLYMVTFGASVTALLVFVYTAIIGDLEEDLKHSISIQISDLARKFTISGARETAASIDNMLDKDEDKTLVLMLIDPQWEVLAGNLDRWPGGKTAADSWIKFPLEKKSQPMRQPPRAIALNTTLPGGYILLVGRKMERIERVQEIIMDVLYVCFGVMVLLAAVGGILLSYTIYRRVETINHVFRRVAAGDFASRVKVVGTGDEFDHLAMHLNQTLARVGELIDGVRDISYSVAHDLRTPLHRLRHRLESLLQEETDPAVVQDELRTAITEIDSVVGTFNAILRIAQAEMGAGVENFTRFNLSEAAENVVELYRPVAEERAQMLETEIAPDIHMQGERHIVSQMMANILDNAIKYTPRQGHIRLSLSMRDQHIVLRVADNGPGIPETYRARVTEKFFRLEQSRSSPGNGLGLSLVHAAVKLHQGDLFFGDNAPGLVVEVLIPAN